MRGFVIGELLVALLLLAVAVSSLAALMYSVSRRPSSAERTECVGKNASSAKCVSQRSGQGGPSKLLRSGCATRLGLADRNCKDTIVSDDNSGETILKARTDSASMALLPKKKERVGARPDRGFIR
jgi:Tfp pilus assembly protein PilV